MFSKAMAFFGVAKKSKFVPIKAASRLGIDLDNISIIKGVAKTRITLTESFNIRDIREITNEMKNRGANRIEIGSGMIGNVDMDEMLKSRLNKGGQFMNGTIRKGDGKKDDYIIEFELKD